MHVPQVRWHVERNGVATAERLVQLFRLAQLVMEAKTISHEESLGAVIDDELAVQRQKVADLEATLGAAQELVAHTQKVRSTRNRWRAGGRSPTGRPR